MSSIEKKQKVSYVTNSTHKKELTNDLLGLLVKPGSTSDLTLTAGRRSFPVHSCILTARCEFFATMFASGFQDASARELSLPNADPDALALLLRYIYGGVIDHCDRKLLKPASELADYLRLSGPQDELRQRLLDSVTEETFVNDMLWTELRGHETLMEALVLKYLSKFVSQRPDGSFPLVDDLAARAPQLLVRLHKRVLARITKSLA